MGAFANTKKIIWQLAVSLFSICDERGREGIGRLLYIYFLVTGHTGKRAIEALRVKCFNVDKKCPWEGTVGTVEAHIWQHVGSLPFPAPTNAKMTRLRQTATQEWSWRNIYTNIVPTDTINASIVEKKVPMLPLLKGIIKYVRRSPFSALMKNAKQQFYVKYLLIIWSIIVTMLSYLANIGAMAAMKKERDKT